MTEVELDREHGRTMWETELSKNNREYEIQIDTATAKVISVDYESETESDD